MRTFIMFIRCALGKTYEVAANLAELDIAPQVYSISGEYDLFCMFSLESDDDVGRFINDKIQTIPDIEATNTIVCFNPFTRDSGFDEDT